MGFCELIDVDELMLWLQICLLCRQRGHSLKNCPDKNEENIDKKLCYNCGGFGHSLALCPQPLVDGNLIIYCALVVFPSLNIGNRAYLGVVWVGI